MWRLSDMVSGIDLLRGERQQPEKTGIDLLKQDQGVRTGLDLLRQPVVTAMPTTEVPPTLDSTKAKEFYSAMPWITPYMGMKGMGPRPEGGFSEEGIPLDIEGKPYVEPKQASGVIAETLQGLSTLATHPMETIKGGLDFVLSVPGFLFGLSGAVSRGSKEAVDQIVLGGFFNLDEIYNAASKGMMEGAQFFEPGKELLIGEPTPESMLTTQVIMAPISVFSTLGQSVASYEGFRDWPNIRGAAKFAGDIGGLIAMGLVIHGASRKANFTTAVERIVRKADEIAKGEQAIEGIPSEIVRETQRKVLDVEKAQLELEAKKVAEQLAKEALVKEEVTKKAEEVAEAKVEPLPEVKIPEFKDTGEAVEFGLKATPEQKAELVRLQKVSNEKYDALMKKEPKDLEAAMEEATKGQLYREALEAKEVRVVEKEIAERVRPVEEPTEPTKPAPEIDWFGEGRERITDLDMQTGTREPVALSTERSPFRETSEHTQRMKAVYEERAKSVVEDPEMFTGKLLNDMNRWLDGEEVPVDLVRDGLSELAARADELRSQFSSGQDFLQWRDVVREGASWARKADRLKIEPIEGVELYAGVPVSKVMKEIIVGARKGLTIFRELTPKKHETFKRYFDSLSDTKKLDLLATGKLKPVVNDFTESLANKLLEIRKTYKKDPRKHAENTYLASKLEEKTITDAELDRWFALSARERIDASYLYDMVKDPNLIDNMSAGVILKDLVPGEVSVTLYAGPPITKAAKELVAGARKLSEYTKRARGLKAFKPKQAARMLREEFNRAFIDRSGNIRRELLDQLGDAGYRIVQKMYLSKGASALSANMLKQMRKEVYSGLPKDSKKIFDDVALAVRMVDVGKYKTPKEFKFPEGLSPAESATYLELFRYKSVNGIRDLTTKEAYDLFHIRDDGSVGGKVGSYFEWMKKPLRDMLDAELITEAEYNDLVSHNYRRIKIVDIYDRQYKTKVGKKRRTIYDSGIEALARGRDTDVFEPSSEIMALEVFNRAYGRILNNKANQTLLELARKDKTNPFVRVKEEKGDMIPTGWSRSFVYEGGQRKSIYLSPEMGKEWITNSPEMSYRMSQFLRYSSGSPVLRTFATGINWGFALANLPRDVMHTWFTARVFEGGKWKPIYNPNAPIFAMQIGRDLATVFTDAALRKGRYEKYIEEGGGMEFLVHQGRLFQRGRHVEGPLDAIYDFMGYFGETSEIMTRLAIRERVLRKGKDSQEATFAARDYMDFGQGGGVAKALDNAFPYLNAAIQGTRGLFRAFKGNPISSTYKLSQFAAVTTGLYVAMFKMHPKSAESLRGNIDMQNNICIPLGDDFGFEDEQGQMRYPYVKIPLDPGQKFFKTFFEASADKWLGNEVDIDRVVDSLKEQSPVGVTELPPTISATLGYVTNKDFWLNEDIWRQTDKPFGWPESREEFIPGRTPQAYIDLGAKTGLSPERTRYAVEELVTSGTVWSYMLGQGYEAAFGDMPKSKKEQHLAMSLSKIPVVRRFYGLTNPYSQYAQPIDRAKEKSDIDRWVQNRELDVRVDGYLFDKTVKRKEVIDYIKGFKDKDIYDRLKERFEFQEKIKDLPNRSFWLRLRSLTTKTRAKIYVDRLNKADEEERKQLKKELATVIRAGGVVSKGFREEVMKLR